MRLRSRWLLAACMAALIALLPATTASAAPSSNLTDVSVASGSAALGGYDIDGIEPATLTVFHLHVTANATWSGDLNTAVGWDSDRVRQGATLGVSRSAPLTGGAFHVTWQGTRTLPPRGPFDLHIR